MSPDIRIVPRGPDDNPDSKTLEARRRQNLRTNYLVPIYVMWTSDVPQEEALAGLQGVNDTV